MAISTKWKFIIQIILTFLFFLCEFFTAQVTDSDTILADAFHMFSDFIALALGLYCSQLAKTPVVNRKFTFGYHRAEILGAFANSVFLAALTFDVVLNAVDRLILVPTQIKNPSLLIMVGILGLVVNICGLIMFCACGSGSSHGHSHDGFSHGHTHGAEDSSNLNIKAVILHLLGDAFGSITVIISAVVIFVFEESDCSDVHREQELELRNQSTHHASGCWVYYVDPALSLIVSTMIAATLVPVLKRSSMILLETCGRKHINISSIKNVLEAKRLESQKAYNVNFTYEDLRVWDLSATKTFLALRIYADNPSNSQALLMSLRQNLRKDFGLEDVLLDIYFSKSEPLSDIVT